MAVQFLKAVPWKHIGIFVAGTLAGNYGAEVFGGKTAKKVYTEVTAAALRVKDEAMKAATTVQENANDILEDAKALNEERADMTCKEVCEEIYEDLSGEAEEVEEAPAKKAPAKKAPAKKPAAKKAPAKK